MIKKIWSFLQGHGYIMMLLGMGIIGVGGYLMYHSKSTGSALDRYSWPIIGIGFACYVAGRVGAQFKNRRSSRMQDRHTDEDA